MMRIPTNVEHVNLNEDDMMCLIDILGYIDWQAMEGNYSKEYFEKLQIVSAQLKKV